MREFEKAQGWFELLSRQLGPNYDIEGRAKACGALLRKRGIASAKDLLRLCFVYGTCGMSFRSTAAFAESCRIASISDVALMKRLRQCVIWLTEIACRLLTCSDVGQKEQRRLQIIDASAVSAPGTIGTDARLHLRFDPHHSKMCSVELTDVRGGEKLTRFSFLPGDIVLGDAVYARNPQIKYVREHGADLVLRCGINSLSLMPESAGETSLQLSDWLASLPKKTQLAEKFTWLRPTPGMGSDAEPIPVRLVAQRLSPKDAQRRAKHARQKAQRNNRKQRANASIASQWMVLVTTLPNCKYSGKRIFEIYRYRWQIEIAFKRLKSQTDFSSLRAKNKDLIQVHLLSNLILSIIAENQIIEKSREKAVLQKNYNRCPFEEKSRWRLMKLMLTALKATILSVMDYLCSVSNIPSIERNLRDPPRKRKLQTELIRAQPLS